MMLKPTGDIDQAKEPLCYFAMEINQRYFTVDEFANMISLTPQYIHRLAKTIPVSLFGNSWTIPSAVLEDRDVMLSWILN